MGRVVVTEFVSLDGVMEAPGGEPGYAHTGWVARVPDGGQFSYKLEEILEAEAHLLGRITYESFAGAWPEPERRGRIRGQDQRDAQVRRLLDPRPAGVEQLPPAGGRRRSRRSGD